MSADPHDCPGDKEQHLATAQEGLQSLPIAWGKDHNSKFKVRLLLNAYHFHAVVKLKNCKSNHCKPGTACICNVDNRQRVNSCNIHRPLTKMTQRNNPVVCK